MINYKIHKFTKSLASETLIHGVEDNSFLLEIKSLILESYTNRVNLNMSQKDYAILKGMSLQSLKRVELKQCFDIRILNKYIG